MQTAPAASPSRTSPASAGETFSRHFGSLLRSHRWPILLASAMVGLHGGAIALQTVFSKWFVDDVILAEDASPELRWQRLAWLAAGYLFVSFFMRMFMWHAGYRIFAAAREKIIFALRARFFRHVNCLCLRFHGHHSSGELFSYLFGTPLGNVMQFFQHASMFLPGAVITLAATVALFWTWDWVIALLITAAAAVSFALMRSSRRNVQIIQKDFQQTEGEISGRVADLLHGAKAVKIHALEQHVSAGFETAAASLRQKTYSRDVRSHIEWMKQEGAAYFCFVALLGVCTWRHLDGHISAGVVTAALTAYASLLGPLQQIFQAVALWAGCAASLERIGAVLDTGSTTPDPPAQRATPPTPGPVTFENVGFGYECDSPVLRNLNFTIPYGQRVALVGPSGAGKTTLVQLVLRLYDPSSGRICINNTDTRGFAGSDLRRLFGVVPQDPFIFRSTVRENLLLARPDATDAVIESACRLANAWEFIERLPGGLSSPVGEGGSKLSGGQRQRLAIARAFLADPPFFVFDEATSALDTLSEKLIQDAIRQNLRGRTAFFVAHRLATVRHCDRILVLRDGRIEQDGTYDELLERPGLFQELARGGQLRE